MRGATVEIENDCDVIKISIHAPMRGATLSLTYTIRHLIQISIHAPMKGATRDQQVFKHV